MELASIAANAIDPYIAELGRDGWTFVAEVESTGEYVELACDVLPTVAALTAGKGAKVRKGRIVREVEDAVESAAFRYGFEYTDFQAVALIEGAWDVAESVIDEVERLSK